MRQDAVLQGDLLSRILTFLEWRDIVKVRRVASSWKAAADEAPVEEEIYVDNRQILQGVARCLSKVSSIRMDQNTLLDDSTLPHASMLAFEPLYGCLTQLKHLKCLHTPTIPACQNFHNLLQFYWRNLQSINLHGNDQLEWELSTLAPLEHLNDIRCINNRYLTGNVQDLLLQNTPHSSAFTSLFYNLTILDISGCPEVTGQLQDFRKLPKLQWLGIARTNITGDLQVDIQPGYFGALQGMGLDNDKVYGAARIDRVSDAPAVMKARHQILQQSTWESPLYPLLVHLSPESNEYHERVEQRLYTSERDPPFSLETVMVGNRRGWRWSNYLGGFCDTHWLDPEPSAANSDDCEVYQTEMAEFQREREASLFAGFMDPPTPEQYRALCRERCL